MSHGAPGTNARPNPDDLGYRHPVRAKTKRARLFALALSSAFFCACDRQPLETICPTLAPGDLVVTELRGPQSGADTYGQWIELYNASGASATLAGHTIQILRLDGGDDGVILVRDHNLTVAAGATSCSAGATLPACRRT